jgi:DNA end-binding protein Ku
MAYRSVWKGFLKLAQIACPVALYAATGEAEHRSFTMINPKTGNKVDFSRVDSVTGEAIAFADMAKGIEVAAGVYKEVTKDELAGIAPPSIHTIEIEELVPRDGIDWLFPDSLYYLGPDGLAAGETFALIRDGIKKTRLAALGQLTMGSREHMVMMEPGEKALKLSTLRYAAEVRSEDAVFPQLLDLPYPRELAEPVRKILDARSHEEFAPSAFTDRYAAAIGQLVRDKIAGTMVKRTTSPPPKLVDLAKAVKRSFDSRGKPQRSDRGRGKAA